MTLTGESSDFDFYYYSQKLNASLSDLEAELNRKLIIASGLPPLTLFRLGGGLFEPPLRQNRDTSYTERAMAIKFSDFS